MKRLIILSMASMVLLAGTASGVEPATSKPKAKPEPMRPATPALPTPTIGPLSPPVASPAPPAPAPTPAAEATPVSPPRWAQPPSANLGNAERMRIEGAYSSADERLWITVMKAGVTHVRSEHRWDATGFFDGSAFTGLLRTLDQNGRPIAGAEYGSLRFTRRSDGTLDATLRAPGDSAPREARWTPEASHGEIPRQPIVVPDPNLPKPGDYVYVEELPEAVTKVAPVYPDDARRRGVDGTVMVQALVGTDGRVKDTKIVKSIPELDAAAIAAVRQWIFKPALSKGAPVAVWVAVPVKFSIH